jgi:hypothetical protein
VHHLAPVRTPTHAPRSPRSIICPQIHRRIFKYAPNSQS